MVGGRGRATADEEQELWYIRVTSCMRVFMCMMWRRDDVTVTVFTLW